MSGTIPSEIFLNGADRFDTGIHQYGLDILGKFDRKEYRFFMLNWARRHLKSTVAINIILKEAWKNPRSVYIYIAPTYKQAKNIMWDDPDMLFLYLPKEIICRISRQEMLIELINGSIVRLMGGDDPDKLRGINARGVVFDEWSVFSHIKVIWQEIFLPILRKDSERWAIFIFTPKGQNEAYNMWLKAQDSEEWYTSELRASQSNIIPLEEYRKAKAETDPLLFAQEYECAFITNEEMTFLTSASIEALKTVSQRYSNTKKCITIDPSLGGDECAIYYIENYRVRKQLIGHWTDDKVISAEAMMLGSEYKCNNYVVDVIGVGHSVYSNLERIEGNNVEPCDVRQKSRTPECDNLKAEMWWTVRSLVNEQKIPYIEDMKLRQQLSSVRFIYRNGLIACEEKTHTKKRIKSSPDRAEAWIQGIYYMAHVFEPEKDTIKDDFDFNVEDDEDCYPDVCVM